MTREKAKEVAKNSLEDYLKGKGINTAKNFRTLDGCSDRDSNNMSYDKKHKKVTCWVCGKGYDVFDVVGMEYGLTDDRDIFDQTYSLLHISIDQEGGRDQESAIKTDMNSADNQQQQCQNKSEPEEDQETDYIEYFRAAVKRISETDYHRGLSDSVLKRFLVGYDPAWRHPKVVAEGKNPPPSPRLIVPTSPYSYIARDTRTNLTEKQSEYKKQKVGNVHIFNLKALCNASRPVFVVEGEIDALSIIDAGGIAIGLGSVSNIGRFLATLDGNTVTQPMIICLDNDDAGQNSTERLAEGLEARGIHFYRRNISTTYKDANEYLMANKEEFTRRITEISNEVEYEEKKPQIDEYLRKYQSSQHIQNFLNGIAASADTPCISTGFKNMDEALDGGLYEGLYSIGAVSSAGKTAFALQVFDQIASSGKDVLIFSLEMARSELMARSISRHTMQIELSKGHGSANAKTNRGITDGRRYINYSDEERALIKEAVSKYSQYSDHVFIQEGIGDIGVKQIRESVEEHIGITGTSPVVLVDYLQILAPTDPRATDKTNIDKSVLELRRISRDYKTPVILVSSLNRESYKTGSANNGCVTLSDMKESGSIEYSCDVVLGFQFQGAGSNGFSIKDAKNRNPRKIEIVVLKNRNGPIDKIARFNYYPLFNLFMED